MRLCACRTQSNPENTVGVLTMAGKGVDVRVAMTSDVGKVLAQSHGAQVCGEINLSAGLQVAGLALKHRQNKNQRQRIIVFVGSPVKEDEKELVKLGKKLKKNSVALDIINFGEEAENTPKLEALLNAVNSDDNSHLVTVPPGPHVLSDILLSSPIVQGEDGGGGGAAMATGGGGGGGFAEFGVDPTLDPEFAWALRVSMEEERQRQENEAKAKAEAAAGGSGEAAAGGAAAGSTSADAPMAEAGGADMDEAALLEAAIAMSQAETVPGSSSMVTPTATGPAATPGAPPPVIRAGLVEPSPPPPIPPPAAPLPADVDMGDANEDMDEEMQLALAMSMSQQAAATPAAPAGSAASDLTMFQDASFLQSVLGSLPGVDPQAVINAMPSNPETKEGEKKEGGPK